MRKPEQTSEPSIEEILASIRRIIADDGMAVHTAESADIVKTAIVEPIGPHHVPLKAGGEAGSDAAGAQATSEDDILELTEDSMLEAPAVQLDEPAEPAAMSYESRLAEFSERDPYAEPAQETAETASLAEKSQGSLGSKLKSLLPDVMAEVRRLADGAASEEPQKSAPAAPVAPAASSETERWGQPQEAVKPSPPPRPASRPVWSARHKENEAPKGRQDPVAASQDRLEAALRKPSLGGKDGWSQGVQMPVPEGGPAIPFTYDGAQEERRAPSATADAARPAPLPRRTDPAPGRGQQPQSVTDAAPPAAQARAEKIADTAISNFALDKLNAPPLGDVLKADKPLMDEITHSLADAIAKGNQQVEEGEETAPPDMHEEGDAPAAAAQFPAAPAGIPNLEGGFVAHQPAVSKAGKADTAEEETPELPREDLSDFLPNIAAETRSPSPLRPRGMAEPVIAPESPAPGARREAAMPSEPFPSLSGMPKTLEDTIKEMLKPLLLQWLNENMPRIVNEAIREEMAEKGLLPRYGGERR